MIKITELKEKIPTLHCGWCDKPIDHFLMADVAYRFDNNDFAIICRDCFFRYRKDNKNKSKEFWFLELKYFITRILFELHFKPENLRDYSEELDMLPLIHENMRERAKN